MYANTLGVGFNPGYQFHTMYGMTWTSWLELASFSVDFILNLL